MTKLIITLFVIGWFAIILSGKLEYYEVPITKAEVVQVTPKTVQKVHKRVVKSKKAEYIPPTGKALELAVRVSIEAKQPLDTVSRIMFYESQGYNLQAKHVNKNKTTDHGAFQINSSHITEAKKMGLDIVNKPDDNASFAIVLMKRNGLKDWNASKHNWAS